VANRFFVTHSVAHSLISQFYAKRGLAEGAHAAPLITARRHAYLVAHSWNVLLLLFGAASGSFAALVPRGLGIASLFK